MAKMNVKRRYTTEKIDSDFKTEMKELAKFRYFKNLENKEPTLAEMTKITRRTDAWKNVVWELKTKARGNN